jgi:hypothetical protein
MRTIRALAAGALLASALAGCGSSSNPSSSTSSAGAARGNGVAAAYRFAACMRDHGVTDFPDPQVTVNATQTKVAIRVVAGSPQSKAAMTACRGILPQPTNLSPAQVAARQQARLAALLSFARCMRAHGITQFPDPTSQGQLSLTMITAAGVDLHAPQVRTAGLACVPASRGLLTRAAVAQATSGTAGSTGNTGWRPAAPSRAPLCTV